MNKKKIVLFSVIVNSFIILLLFITSVKLEKEKPIISPDIVKLEDMEDELKDILPPNIISINNLDKKIEEKIIHHLPEKKINEHISGKDLFIPNVKQKEESYYIVKKGDSPWSIAMKNNLKLDDLIKLNNLDNEKAKKLRPGDKLRIH